MLAVTERHGTPAVSARNDSTRPAPPMSGAPPGVPINADPGRASHRHTGRVNHVYAITPCQPSPLRSSVAS